MKKEGVFTPHRADFGNHHVCPQRTGQHRRQDGLQRALRTHSYTITDVRRSDASRAERRITTRRNPVT
eukprot:6540744-Pyramimonas_sp.AAC.1